MDPAGAPADTASARLAPAVITAVGFLLAIAGTMAPESNGQLSGSAAIRPMIALPDWLPIVVVGAFSAGS